MIGRLLRVPSHKRAAGLAPQLYQLAIGGNEAAAIELRRLANQAATARAKAIYAQYANQLPKTKTGTPAAPTTVASPYGNISPQDMAVLQRLGIAVTGAAVRSATRTTRGRGRTVSRYDPDTGRKRKVPVGSFEDLNWPATKSAYRALVGGGTSAGVRSGVSVGGGAGRGASSNLARAGVIIGGLAAGYYIGTQLNKYLAGRALGKEQAGVQAALAFRRAREDAAANKGAALTPAEVRSMGDVYKRQLLALGYDPQTFTRTRSTVERFFTGEEES